MKMEMETVPCVVSTMSEEQAKKCRIADNKTGEFSSWDMDALMAELREVGADDMQKYFDDIDIAKELDKFAGGANTAVTGADVHAATVRQHTRFVGGTTDVVDVTCPHCLKDFGLRKSDLPT